MIADSYVYQALDYRRIMRRITMERNNAERNGHLTEVYHLNYAWYCVAHSPYWNAYL